MQTSNKRIFRSLKINRVGTALWHYLEEDNGSSRCYLGTIKAIRAINCIVEYDRAERLPDPLRRGPPFPSYPASKTKTKNNPSWDEKRGYHNGGSVSSRGRGERAPNGGTVGGRRGCGRRDARAGWAGYRLSAYEEEVKPFRVTLPRSQLSTLVINGKSPAAAKLAAHGVVCEVSLSLSLSLILGSNIYGNVVDMGLY